MHKKDLPLFDSNDQILGNKALKQLETFKEFFHADFLAVVRAGSPAARILARHSSGVYFVK